VIFEHGGTLDKFIGDAIMALWGAPIAHGTIPTRAPRRPRDAAVHRAAQRALGQPGAGRDRVGIGINHGEVFAGNIGSHRRLEYTVIATP